jgi:hypothetical protein
MRDTLISCWGLLIFALSVPAQTTTGPVPDANPARPTVSTPATLTPTGYLQFETGSLGATTSPEFGTRIGINQVTKLTVLPRLEFLVLTEPYIHSSNSRGGDKEIHPGEVFVGARAILLPGDGTRPTIAVSYIRRLYESPAPELDIGTNRQGGTILSERRSGGLSFRRQLRRHRANRIRREASAAGTNAVDFASAEEVHRFRRNPAFYAALFQFECGR